MHIPQDYHFLCTLLPERSGGGGGGGVGNVVSRLHGGHALLEQPLHPIHLTRRHFLLKLKTAFFQVFFFSKVFSTWH